MRGGAFISALCAAKRRQNASGRRKIAGPKSAPAGAASQRDSTPFAPTAFPQFACVLAKFRPCIAPGKRDRRKKIARRRKKRNPQANRTAQAVPPVLWNRLQRQSVFSRAQCRAARKIPSASQGKRLEDAAALRSRLYLFQSPRIMALCPSKARFPMWQARLPGGAAPPGIRGDAPVCPPESGLPVRAR